MMKDVNIFNVHTTRPFRIWLGYACVVVTMSFFELLILFVPFVVKCSGPYSLPFSLFCFLMLQWIFTFFVFVHWYIRIMKTCSNATNSDSEHTSMMTSKKTISKHSENNNYLPNFTYLTDDSVLVDHAEKSVVSSNGSGFIFMFSLMAVILVLIGTTFVIIVGSSMQSNVPISNFTKTDVSTTVDISILNIFNENYAYCSMLDEARGLYLAGYLMLFVGVYGMVYLTIANAYNSHFGKKSYSTADHHDDFSSCPASRSFSGKEKLNGYQLINNTSKHLQFGIVKYHHVTTKRCQSNFEEVVRYYKNSINIDVERKCFVRGHGGLIIGEDFGVSCEDLIRLFHISDMEDMWDTLLLKTKCNTLLENGKFEYRISDIKAVPMLNTRTFDFKSETVCGQVPHDTWRLDVTFVDK